MSRTKRWSAVATAMLVLAGCSGEAPPKPSAASAEASAVQAGIEALVAKQIDAWLTASRELQAAAPEPTDRGWDAKLDAEAIARMKQHWREARVAYELIEGAIAPIFPESDTATDARYDDFLAALGGAGDQDAFDGEGIVGMHAIERILWADAILDEVTTFERGIPGYQPAKQPATAAQAKAFKHGLAQRLVIDVERLHEQFETIEFDVAFAFRGLLDLAVEQAEKVDRAATGQEESRYAQTTMRDLRANYQGCLDAYRVFRPWLMKSQEGAAIDAEVDAAFERLRAAYAAVPGDAIPRPPATWSSLTPSDADRQSPFGRLFSQVAAETEVERVGSLHHGLVRVADALGLPKQVAQ